MTQRLALHLGAPYVHATQMQGEALGVWSPPVSEDLTISLSIYLSNY
jgi:hypothetical protein